MTELVTMVLFSGNGWICAASSRSLEIHLAFFEQVPQQKISSAKAIFCLPPLSFVSSSFFPLHPFCRLLLFIILQRNFLSTA